MLQLLIGPSGSGKTHRILDTLAALTEQGQSNILWLVPEQYSFESERAILRALGPVHGARVRVLSFSRLADMVAREVGGLAGRRLDEGMRALLMSRALTQVAQVAEDTDTPTGGLRMRLATDSAYVEQLLTLWEEVRRCAVATDELEGVAAQLSDEEGLLAQKMETLYRVFSVYEGLAADTGLDELDELTRLVQRLPHSRIPDEAIVFVDGFKGFTVQELRVLEAFMPRVRQMTVALCTDTPGGRWPQAKRAECAREYPLFSPVTDTILQLHRAAQRHQLTWELTQLTENHRTHNAALQALERGLYAPKPEVYDGEAVAVTVTPCEDVYEECAYAVRHIRRLLREENYRCRDITVAVRNPADYQGILDEMLSRENIPCYMDQRQDILCEPLVVYIRAALRLAIGGWHTEEMLRMMKTDLWPLSPTEIAEMENYVYTWGIDGQRWEREWTENPAGLGRPMNDYDQATLERLNRRRAALMKALTSLRLSLQGKVSGRQFATAVYTWLRDQKELPARITAQIEILEEAAQPVLAAHAERLWDEVMHILDRFALALGEQTMPASQLEELFTLLCRTIDMGTIPQSLDAVTVGGADRIRYNAPRAVIVLGANEGVFPAYPTGDGILSEEERHRLQESGLVLANDVLTQCVEERYYAYLALTAPSERLTVTYQTGGEQAPSPLIDTIRHILPHHTVGVARAADGHDLESTHEMFDRLAQEYTAASPLTHSLRQVLEEHADYAPRMAAVARAASGEPFRIEQRENAEGLFGTNLCLSASQTELFYQCHFAYFCRYGLRVQPRRSAQVDASVFGTLVHYLMETLLPTYTAKDGLVDTLRDKPDAAADRQLRQRLEADVTAATDAYLSREMGGADEKSGRFLYQVGLARRSACNMLWHTLMELRQSEFVPVDFELNIHPAEDTEAEGVVSLRLPTAAGSVQVRGQVDRVDLFRRFDGTVFVRVVDYKTGTKTFEMNEITAGLGTQMLLYLFILCDNSRRYLEETGQLKPGGVLYHPLSDLVVDRGQDASERLKQMRMSGVVLDDPSVVLAMEKEGGNLFVPAKLDKEGQPTGQVITLHQFDLLRKTVEALLIGMADTLLEGDIAALPLQKGNTLRCRYCDYRAICGRDAEDPVRELTPKSMKQVLADMEAEEVSDGE